MRWCGYTSVSTIPVTVAVAVSTAGAIRIAKLVDDTRRAALSQDKRRHGPKGGGNSSSNININRGAEPIGFTLDLATRSRSRQRPSGVRADGDTDDGGAGVGVVSA